MQVFIFLCRNFATAIKITTDGTDKFKGAAMVAVDDGAKKLLSLVLLMML